MRGGSCRRRWAPPAGMLGAVLLLAPACAARKPPPPEPPEIVGEMKPVEILAHSAAYRSGYEAYQPDPAPVELIASSEVPLLVEVMWASWCADSEREVPHFLRILDLASQMRAERGLGPLPLEAEFVAVNRAKDQPAERLRGKGIERVPTFIVRSAGREVGRIVESPVGLLEEDLALMVLEAMSGGMEAAPDR